MLISKISHARTLLHGNKQRSHWLRAGSLIGALHDVRLLEFVRYLAVIHFMLLFHGPSGKGY